MKTDPPARIEIQIGPELFRFTSHAQWVNKAASWFKHSGAARFGYVCIDAAGRVCTHGKQFGRARDEETFPVIVYAVDPELRLRANNES